MRNFKNALLLCGLGISLSMVSCGVYEGDVLQTSDRNIVRVWIKDGTLPNAIIAGQFDQAGIKLIVSYSDGTQEEIALTSSLIPEKYRSLLDTVGTYEIEILYRGQKVIITINIVKEYYTVNFYAYQNKPEYTLISTVNVPHLGNASAPSVPADFYHEGMHYFFRGWDKAITDITSDLKVYGVYEFTPYHTVTFYDGNEEVIKSEIVDQGEGATAPTEEERAMEGYDFVGWDRGYTNIQHDTDVHGLYVVVSEKPEGSDPVPIIPTVFPDNVTVDFWATGSQAMTTELQRMAYNFEEAIKNATGKTVTVNVTIEGSYSDLADKISRGLAIGNVPTMALAYPDTVASIIEREADKPYLFDITPYLSDATIGFGKQNYLGDESVYGESDIVSPFLDEGTHYAREGMYSFPFVKSSEVMFYNVEAVERAYQFYKPTVIGNNNIRKDLTSMAWEEFENLLTVVQEHKSDILSTLENAVWYDSDSNWILTQMMQRGIKYTSIKDGKGSIDFKEGEDRTALEGALSHLKELYDDGRITTKGIENTYGSNAFTNGKVLFEVGSSGGTGYSMPDGIDADTIGVVPVPAYDGNASYVSQGPTITFLRNPVLQDAENEAKMFYAWQFAKYLTNPDTNVRLCVLGSEGYIPIRYSAYETAAYQEFLEDNSLIAHSAKVLIEDIQDNYYTVPAFKGSAQLRDAMGGVVPYVFKGEKTANKAISDAIDYASTFMN